MRVQVFLRILGTCVLIAGVLRAQDAPTALIRPSADPERDALAALEVAKALIDTNPAASLECSSKAAEADPARQRWFWPLMLAAQIRLGHWEAADRLGAKSVEEIEAGRMFGRVTDVSDEAVLRRAYAQALDHRGKIDEVRLQLAIAARLSGDPDIADARSSSTVAREWSSRAGSIVAREWTARVDRAKAELLADEIRQAAPEVHLKDIDGHAVALADFRGRVVIAAFWATWCGPCLRELGTLNDRYPRFRDRAEVLAIDVDDSWNVIAEFAKKNAYTFPILKPDKSVAPAYINAPGLEGANIPQLYVIDREGNIRFHLTGFDDDGLFGPKLEWMITASASR
jgi:peroxiredoxin